MKEQILEADEIKSTAFKEPDEMPPISIIEESPLVSCTEATIEESPPVSCTEAASAGASAAVPMDAATSKETARSLLTIKRKIQVLDSVTYAVDSLLSGFEQIGRAAWDIRAPLSILIAIGFFPKLILLWVLIILTKPCLSWVYRKMPEEWKERLNLGLPSFIKNSAFLSELNEGAEQGLPFILFWLYLCFVPFSLLWIAIHWCKGFFEGGKSKTEIGNSFIFTQNKATDRQHNESNFYHSRAFGISFLLFFALGIPAIASFSVYEHLGIEKLIQKSVRKPISNHNSRLKLEAPIVGLVNRQWLEMKKNKIESNSINSPQGGDCTVVMAYQGYWPWLRDLGVEPSKASVFFVHFYLASLGSAICLLFFRTWFLFPLNFVSDEHDIVFNDKGIKRKSFKSWFSNVITINRWASGGGPDSLKWSEVKCLRKAEDGFTKLFPLPETAFKKETLSYKLLNKCAAFIDGLSTPLNSGNYLVFSGSVSNDDFGRNIKINLNELNREQRAKLFYAVKQWAPQVTVSKAAEEQLIGSTVLRDNRYTQLWFDILTSRTQRKRQNTLNPGESLKSGEYTVIDRISSGGQATTYLAKKSSGEQIVLKEFILATSSSGVLIESAREFEAEVSLLSQLDHPGIVKLQDFFTDSGRVYVVLEQIPGKSLRQKVQEEGALDEKEVSRIARSLCEIIEYLHSCSPAIVHRDITPENILVQPDGTVKLIDFSLAVRNDGRQTTESCAKQCFTPPEQFREEVCTQSDIYALGATMYFMLTGQSPKPISTSSPKAKAPHISEQTNAIVQHATELDLDKRYESINWLKLDLTKVPASTENEIMVEAS
ncbi:MAG: serine/threonine protein kinase [Candidatus Obscuribacterales bacterium]|nr:serine/threonine protein kinase [Candidatus Obscuribacterales bacterium]